MPQLIKIPILILSILLTFNSYSQNKKSVLVIPLTENLVDFGQHVAKMIEYNNLDIDSVKNYVVNTSLNKLFEESHDYSFHNLENNLQYNYIIDSLYEFKQWNSFEIKTITNVKGEKKVKAFVNRNQNMLYWGRVVDAQERIIFQSLIKEYDYDYVLFINRFKTVTKIPFSKTSLQIQYEIYNSSFEKIYGYKRDWSIIISQKMYGNVFNYFVQEAFETHCSNINKYLNKINNE